MDSIHIAPKTDTANIHIFHIRESYVRCTYVCMSVCLTDLNISWTQKIYLFVYMYVCICHHSLSVNTPFDFNLMVQIKWEGYRSGPKQGRQFLNNNNVMAISSTLYSLYFLEYFNSWHNFYWLNYIDSRETISESTALSS